MTHIPLGRTGRGSWAAEGARVGAKPQQTCRLFKMTATVAAAAAAEVTDAPMGGTILLRSSVCKHMAATVRMRACICSGAALFDPVFTLERN